MDDFGNVQSSVLLNIVIRILFHFRRKITSTVDSLHVYIVPHRDNIKPKSRYGRRWKCKKFCIVEHCNKNSVPFEKENNFNS